ncbi:PDZ domain-containing protein [Lipingzhangella sp. LS1_29]|uniref:PDZ domain-containing protein n=1 Tax=Lipingzhangella rawalii TaxID=2055835 RepID=A0ABU2HB54_9ACTN|nr:PDZ domain-containing protein [Lipingzhangella rawalii]MDS1272547.1 PDZ domain-containing protein [Lipingzhangella rawalii]
MTQRSGDGDAAAGGSGTSEPAGTSQAQSLLVRRGSTVLVTALVLVALTLASHQLPVPYLIASPGVSLNTLGEQDGDPIIEIEGRENFQHEDAGLSMVTVQYSGGPQHRVSLLAAIGAWVRPSLAVLPEEAVFPPGSTVEEVTETQSLQMDSSQRLAIAAALDQLEIPYDESPLVAEVFPDMPATDELEPGDVIRAVDGAEVDTQAEVVERVSAREPGDPVEITVVRADGDVDSVEDVDVGEGDRIDLTLDTVAADDTVEERPEGTRDEDEGEDTAPDARIGILVESKLEFPFEIDVSVDDIGGPSAGMMFALGIMNRLSDEDLTGGHHIAGTGTVQPQLPEDAEDPQDPEVREWRVGSVSGVAQKMISAEDQGADYFFVAEDSCPQTESSAATDIQVVSVTSLADAVAALETIRTEEDPDGLPSCSD